MTDKRFNPELASRLDDPERLKWLPPTEVIRTISVQAGDVVADVGAGTGYFSFPLAKATGPVGVVYAIDAQEEMLALLRQKLVESAVKNVELVRAVGDRTGMPAGYCNLVFLANVWHEFGDRSAVLREALRILNRPGRIAILDWRPDVERIAGPPLEHRIDPGDASSELSSAGFEQITRRNIGRYAWLVQGTVHQS